MWVWVDVIWCWCVSWSCGCVCGVWFWWLCLGGCGLCRGWVVGNWVVVEFGLFGVFWGGLVWLVFGLVVFVNCFFLKWYFYFV